jgi:hypothetical protein
MPFEVRAKFMSRVEPLPSSNRGGDEAPKVRKFRRLSRQKRFLDEQDTLALKKLGELASHTLVYPSMKVYSNVHP